MRMSREVLTPMLVAAGALGLPLLVGLSRCSEERSEKAPTELSADQEVANNSFLPGVGYYHAPFHAWFPMPYNQFEPSRGYYRGGSWHKEKDDQDDLLPGRALHTGGIRSMPVSRPSEEAVSRANSALRAHSSAPLGHAPAGVTRGGFGSSSHPAFS